MNAPQRLGARRAGRRLQVRAFGTYDERRHPRVAVLLEGLREVADVHTTNVPADIDTARRVSALGSPARLPLLIPTVVRAWAQLVVRSRRGPRPDIVLVGHLGHLDILLARLLFPRATLYLDYLISVADTARDRSLASSRLLAALLRALDWVATRTADVVIVDTAQNIESIPPSQRSKAVVAPVGASRAWFEATPTSSASDPDAPLRVVFYGLFTPLQGTPIIGAALRRLWDAGVPVEATLIGNGQERSATEQALGPAAVTWHDWVDSTALPQLVADHDVCLGIFGTGPKARRVVPNKVYQGAAAGCAVVTSDTPPQRAALPDACVFVPPGDSGALADALIDLADRHELLSRRTALRRHAEKEFTAPVVANRMLQHLDVWEEQ